MTNRQEHPHRALCRGEGRMGKGGVSVWVQRKGGTVHFQKVTLRQLGSGPVSQKRLDRALGQEGDGGACPLGTPLGPSPPKPHLPTNPNQCGKFFLLMRKASTRFELWPCHEFSEGQLGGPLLPSGPQFCFCFLHILFIYF